MNPLAPSRHFADRLDAAVRAKGTPCLLGLDPHLELLPEPFAIAADPRADRAARARAVGDFLVELVALSADRVAAVKPQSAFFEQLGADGAVAWERVVRAAHEHGLLVVGDVKRGDIGSTSAAYAKAFLEGEGDPSEPHLCDAITVNPMLGGDAMKPFLDACARVGKGIYVLVRTSNPGSADFQTPGDPNLSDRLASAVARWGAPLVGASGLSSVGAVIGATHPSELAAFRRLLPHTPFLVPGFGAQGARAQDVVGAFVGDPAAARGALIAASRSVSFAHRRPELAGRSWQDAASTALDEMIASIRSALSGA